MNYELLNPFVQDYPESLTSTLHYGHTTAIRFNKKGQYLAAGLVDGSIVIWDLLTFKVSHVLRGHTRTVQSVRWSENGRYILSAARDWRVILWDLETGKEKYVVRTDAPIWIADLHPDNIFAFCAALVDEDPILVHVDQHDGSIETTRLPTAPMKAHADESKSEAKQYSLVCVFDPSGKYIYGGTTKGWLNVIDYETRQRVQSYRITNSNLKEIRFSLSQKNMATNSTDRIIRTLPTYPHRRAMSESGSDNEQPDQDDGDRDDAADHESDLPVEHKFQDQVNRLQWNSCAFSANGDYVMASTFQSGHDIYVWERNMGSLVKILEGPKEELTDIDWHPIQPMVIAAGLDTGTIYIWAVAHVESWSAFAPDFKELEENAPYEEREDEFDVVPDETARSRDLQATSERHVDVVGSDYEQQYLMPVGLDDDTVGGQAASEPNSAQRANGTRSDTGVKRKRK